MIEDKIRADLVTALKAKEKTRVSVLRLLIADIHNKEIEKQKPPTEAEVVALIQRQIKQHQEAIDLYLQGKRADLVAKEKAETDILNTYVPQQLSPPQLEKIIKETATETGASGPGDFEKLMGAVMGKIKGKADGATVAELIKKTLLR